MQEMGRLIGGSPTPAAKGKRGLDLNNERWQPELGSSPKFRLSLNSGSRRHSASVLLSQSEHVYLSPPSIKLPWRDPALVPKADICVRKLLHAQLERHRRIHA